MRFVKDLICGSAVERCPAAAERVCSAKSSQIIERSDSVTCICFQFNHIDTGNERANISIADAMVRGARGAVGGVSSGSAC